MRRRQIEEALGRLAPRIPRYEAGAVIDHATGSAALRSARPEDAAWLSLVAFVRHAMTEYDALLREGYDRGRPTEDAVTHGIKTTAGVVTSAAIVMISVFAIFATLSLLIFKQLGVGLAVAAAAVASAPICTVVCSVSKRRVVAGRRPKVKANPSIERTAQRPLRALCAAAHVAR